jgi:hypothetical protein
MLSNRHAKVAKKVQPIQDVSMNNSSSWNMEGVVSMFGMLMKHQETMVKVILADRIQTLPLQNVMLENSHNQTTKQENSHNITTNKNFNLQFFLNEECKNAMNISDFIKNVIVTMEDLEHIGKVGYTEGMSNILSKALSEKEHTERPLHCTDVKRETIYVRKNDAWEKDTDKEETKRLIQHIAHKNYKALAEWRGEHPEYDTADSGDYEAWYRISRNICNPDPAALNKLVRHLAMSTAVEKSEATNVLL